jgi:hypothetical protein
MTNKSLTVGLIAVAIIAIIALFTPVGSLVQKAGGVTNYDELDATAIKAGGANGTRLGPIISGNCALIVNAQTVTASTTKAFDCAVTGVVSGDPVWAQFATTTPGTVPSNGWAIVGAAASSTNGFITVLVSNLTGATASPNVLGISSSTNYFVAHTVASVPGL